MTTLKDAVRIRMRELLDDLACLKRANRMGADTDHAEIEKRKSLELLASIRFHKPVCPNDERHGTSFAFLGVEVYACCHACESEDLPLVEREP